MIDIMDLVDLVNIAEELEGDKLSKIADEVMTGYEHDRSSRQEWEDQANEALKLVNLKHEEKHTPIRNASNVKVPVIARASMQFTSNLIPELIKQDAAARPLVIGMDPDGQKMKRAERATKYINYQLCQKNGKWKDSIEKTLSLTSIVGMAFRKLHYDPVQKEVKATLCGHDEVYINNEVTSFDELERITHKIRMRSNSIISNIRAGVFLDELEHIDTEDEDDKYQEIIEQHCLLDLDEDDYAEPYIVTVHPRSGRVLRIVPRFEYEDIQFNEKDEVVHIEPTQYFVLYPCITAFDGSMHSIGFGQLLESLNRSMNTTINQLHDSGRLANTPTGFIAKSMNLKTKDIKLKPGELQVLDMPHDKRLGDVVEMLNFKEPSGTLFQLFGALDQSAKELSTINDATTGNQLAQNAPATSVMALIERGMKVFNAIQKRIFRAMNDELRLVFKLNRIYLDQEEYARVLDDPEAILENDFENQSLDIQTIADPEMSSDAQRMAQSQFLIQLMEEQEIDRSEVLRRVLKAANIPNIELLLPEESQNGQSMKQQQMEQQNQLEQQRLQLEQQAAELEQFKVQIRAEKEVRDTAEKMEKLEVEREKIKMLERNSIRQSQVKLAGDSLKGES